MKSFRSFRKLCEVNLRTTRICESYRYFTTISSKNKNVKNINVLMMCSPSSCYLETFWRQMGTHSAPPKGSSVTAKEEEIWAQDLIFNLSTRQRKTLYEELYALKTIEDDKESAKEPFKPLTSAQMKQLALFAGIPFIGFGTLDNIIMITAGEYIDTTFGAVLGISTMAAAAIGNMVSDVAGISTAGYVETIASKSGIKPPRLTPQQLDNKSTRIVASLGRIIGVTIGCIIGMTPLLFYNRDDDDKDDDKENGKS